MVCGLAEYSDEIHTLIDIWEMNTSEYIFVSSQENQYLAAVVLTALICTTLCLP